MYLTVDSLIKTNNIITGSNNITLRKVNVKPYGFDKMYMDKEFFFLDKELIEATKRKLHLQSFIQYS